MCAFQKGRFFWVVLNVFVVVLHLFVDVLHHCGPFASRCGRRVRPLAILHLFQMH